MSTRADTGAAGASLVAARELALEVAGLIGRETLAPLLDARQAAAILNVPSSWIAAEARRADSPRSPRALRALQQRRVDALVRGSLRRAATATAG